MTDDEFADWCERIDEFFLKPKTGQEQVILVIAAVSRFLYTQYTLRLERDDDADMESVVHSFETGLRKAVTLYRDIQKEC